MLKERIPDFEMRNNDWEQRNFLLLLLFQMMARRALRSGIVARLFMQTVNTTTCNFIYLESTAIANSFVFSFPLHFDSIQSPTERHYFERLAVYILAMFKYGRTALFHTDWFINLFKSQVDLLDTWSIQTKQTEAVYHYYYPIMWCTRKSASHMFDKAICIPS